MLPLAALPAFFPLLVIAIVGLILGALVNWATYRFAWFNPRDISPWGPTPEKAPPRSWSDRIPVWGWWRLRRETALHGRGFWIRPLLIELAMGVGLATLFWWEVSLQRLVVPQLEDLFRMPLALTDAIPTTWAWATFVNHALLITLMAAASFIDIDEKIIPDEITVPGTLLGLTLATLLPMSLLPHIDARPAAEVLSAAVSLPAAAAGKLNAGLTTYVEPVTLAAPNEWPATMSHWRYLLLGQACWWLWCFALTPRIWRGRHGVCRALCLVLRRVARELSRPPLAIIAWIGSLAIATVWWFGGPAWIGLLTSLIGLAVSGGMVWVVRLVGTAALRREAMGFGDVTLMMMIGTFLGWQASVVIFFVAPFAGLLVGISQAVTRRDDVIPYGPFLCLGALFVMVRWADVWNRTQFAFHEGWLVPVVLLVCFALLGIMLWLWQQIKMNFFG